MAKETRLIDVNKFDPGKWYYDYHFQGWKHPDGRVIGDIDLVYYEEELRCLVYHVRPMHILDRFHEIVNRKKMKEKMYDHDGNYVLDHSLYEISLGGLLPDE